jgi:hypothetical protein
MQRNDRQGRGGQFETFYAINRVFFFFFAETKSVFRTQFKERAGQFTGYGSAGESS